MENSQDTSDDNEYVVLNKTDTISSKITDIIDQAEDYCFLVTPYFNEWVHLERSLKVANNQKKRIVFFFREKQNSDIIEDKKKKEKIKEFHDKFNFDIIFIENLHAKIYLNEKEAIITSMNLYEYSSNKNFEVGILIRNKDTVNRIANDIILEYIYKTGKVDKLTLKGNYYNLLETNDSLEKNIRYCVHCGKSMENINAHLYCEPCQEKLIDFNKNNFNFCNICGNSTKEKKLSLCSTCYKKYKKDV